MNNAQQVDEKIKQLKVSGIPLSDAAWEAALACEGWPYIFGAKWQECTIAYRKQVSGKGQEAKYQNVKEKCQAIRTKNPTGSCSGCKWLPGGKRVRSFDCRGFTWWILKQIYNWELKGSGCTSQWNNKSNWKAQGEIADGIPEGVIVCVFYYKKDKQGRRTTTLEHTGLYYKGETCECSAGVQHSETLNEKWDVWGIPACVDAEPTPGTGKPTLRKGDSGPYVTLAQTELIKRGYDLGKWGADGKFGAATESAVKLFQQDWELTVDGVIGPKTWDMLESTPVRVYYTAVIPHLSLKDAEALAALYPGSRVEKEAEI